jgi:hypothetical protein
VSDPLQLDRAEYTQPQTTSCAGCQREIRDTYYEVNRKVLCTTCHAAVAASLTGGSRSLRFFTALGYGLGAAAAGSILYYGVRAITGYELGLISILVGYAVGTAVKKGSGGRGGWFYQALAIFLTYTSIVMNYLPDVVKVVQEQSTGHLGVIGWVLITPLMILFAYGAPILSGFQNVLGLLIIGFGVYEAWKINKRVVIQINGPYRLAPPAPVSPDSPAAPDAPGTPVPPVAADGG